MFINIFLRMLFVWFGSPIPDTSFMTIQDMNGETLEVDRIEMDGNDIIIRVHG